MKSFRRHHRPWQSGALRPWIVIILTMTSSLAMAGSGYESEFIPFPEVTIHFYDRDVPPIEQHGSDPKVDFFYTADYHHWRLLSEFLVSDDERDLERFIIGRVSPGGRQMWLGRNHSDIDQWNRLFHRETYLQTTIHRPGIIEFEDEGGVLPTHITGISVEDNWNAEVHDLIFRFTIGLGPTLKGQELFPYDLLKLNANSHDLAFTAMVSDPAVTDNFKDSGIFLGYAIIPSQENNIEKVKQTVLGAYTNYNTSLKMVWRASAFYIVDDASLIGGAKQNDSFVSAYLQPEYNLNMRWTLYGRLELNSGTKDDVYVQQIPSFISNRTLVGVRYQMESSQVIKLELAKQRQYGQRFLAAEVQWSAAFP